MKTPTSVTLRTAWRRPSSSMAYVEVYMSALKGACAGRVCTVACQTMINNMVNKCQGQTFYDPESDTKMPFSQRAAAILALIGPTDCDYSI